MLSFFQLFSKCEAQSHTHDQHTWSCVSTRYWFGKRAAMTLRIFLGPVLTPKEVGHVSNNQRMRTHPCTHQKTTRSPQGVLEQRHINARYVCFVSHGCRLRAPGNRGQHTCPALYQRPKSAPGTGGLLAQH